MQNAQQSILSLGENLAIPCRQRGTISDAQATAERNRVVETCLRRERDDARQQLAVSQTICNDLRNSEALLHAEIEELSREKDLYAQKLVHTEDLLHHDGALVTQLRNDLSVALTMIARYAFQAEEFDEALQEAVVTIDRQESVIFDQGIYILGMKQAIAQGLVG